MNYAVIVHSAKVLYSDGSVASEEGDPYWAIIEPEGWVEATSVRAIGGGVPTDVKTWASRDAAEKFAQNWKGHPWWLAPRGTYEIVPIEPKMVVIQKGWQRAKSRQGS